MEFKHPRHLPSFTESTRTERSPALGGKEGFPLRDRDPSIKNYMFSPECKASSMYCEGCEGGRVGGWEKARVRGCEEGWCEGMGVKV